MIGELMSPVLEEMENALWDWESSHEGKPEFTEHGFRAACKIFLAVIMDKMWEVQEWDKMDMKEREKMALKAGEDIRHFIKTYTNIDSKILYKTK